MINKLSLCIRLVTNGAATLTIKFAQNKSSVVLCQIDIFIHLLTCNDLHTIPYSLVISGMYLKCMPMAMPLMAMPLMACSAPPPGKSLNLTHTRIYHGRKLSTTQYISLVRII